MKLLPDLHQIEYVSCTFGRFGQPMLETVSKMHWLKELKFGQLRAKDLTPVEALQDLECLVIHALSSATRFNSVCKLPRLKRLALGLNSKIDNLNELSNCSNSPIEELELYGSSESRQPRLRSLKPLANFKSLRRLSILLSKLEDPDLSFLDQLPNLESVHILGTKTLDKSAVKFLTDRGIKAVIGK